MTLLEDEWSRRGGHHDNVDRLPRPGQNNMRVSTVGKLDATRKNPDAYAVAGAEERTREARQQGLLARCSSSSIAARGEFELCKTTWAFDSTATNPDWLGEESQHVREMVAE